MTTLRALSTLLCLAAASSAAGVSCASKDDRSLGNPAGSGGSGASGGSTNIALTGGTSGTSGTSGTGATDNAGAGDGSGVAECSFAGLNCGGSSLEADLRVVNMLLVIDKSGSMTDSLGNEDKWTAMKSALAASLARVGDEMNFGLELFPYSRSLTIPEVGCEPNCFDLPDGDAAILVPLRPGTDVTGEISAELEATKPGGGTPTAKALRSAFDYFTQGAGASVAGNNYVLLATDGGPNGNSSLTCEAATCTTNLDGQCDEGNCCSFDNTHDQCLDDTSVIDALEALHDAGIPTFVVGLPGTDQYAAYLDEFADAGGVPNSGATKYYAVAQSQGVQGLTDVFNTITTQLVRSCDIPLSEPPTKSSLVNVAIDCDVVAPMSADGSGWHLDDPNAPTEVILEGPVCDRLQTDGARRVDVIFGCPTVR